MRIAIFVCFNTNAIIFAFIWPIFSFSSSILLFFSLPNYSYLILISPFSLPTDPQVSQWYDLVVFTASMEIYGAAVADKLDNGRNILRRRYYRQHCTPDFGSYTKDLTAICNDLNRVISYRYFVHFRFRF